MALFTWKDEYSVGCGRIDRQHRRLFEIGEELHAAMASGQGREALAKMLAGLVEHSRLHFITEEHAMREHEYPGFEAHRGEHESLMARLEQFQAGFNSGKVTISIQILYFIKHWLEHHMRASDGRFGDYLRSREAAA